MKSKIHRYEGQEVTVTFDAARCIHAGECVGRIPAVFRPSERPWVTPDAAGAEVLTEAISHCPSGALQIETREGKPAETPPLRNTARLVEDGPTRLTGEIELTNDAGELIARETRVALCRCGKSSNKPFCDNSHTKAEFRDAGLLGHFPQPMEHMEEDRLQLRFLSNGPVVTDGPLEIFESGGKASIRCGKSALCRCGASENKPFCDGSHRKIGFKTSD